MKCYSFRVYFNFQYDSTTRTVWYLNYILLQKNRLVCKY
uniref:Uncharacterized protein n=1 Tax=Heterorhabditis bacteriophora TaxID=37862 RepID=A0A1I7WHV7_HETBA